jgi:hypothetical protein
MSAFMRFAVAGALVLLSAGSVLAQAQAPVTSAPPPARTPSVLTGPPTGLPKAGPPASDPRLSTPPVQGVLDPNTGQVIDPRTGQPINSAAPPPARTPSVLTGPGR